MRLLPKIAGALLFTFLFIGQSQAQNFRPFSQGNTYEFLAQDSIRSVRIDSVFTLANGDSVFVFNKVAKPVTNFNHPNCGGGNGLITHQIDELNIFGKHMIAGLNGEFSFILAPTDTIIIKTQAPIGQTWTFRNGTPPITASIVSRGIEPIQSVTDSVLTINLSNGRTVKLSKNYGFIATHRFDDYLTSDTTELALYTLQEKGLGRSISNPFAIYDFQVGDEFRYYTEGSTQYGICDEMWKNMKVLTRYISPAGDTIKYTFETQYLAYSYGSPSAPFGFCQNQSGSSLSPVYTETEIITPLTNSYLTNLSHDYFIAQPNSPEYWSHVNLGISQSIYNNRFSSIFTERDYNSCADTFAEMVDNTERREYTFGLGLTFINHGSYPYNDYTILEYYKKGNEQYGEPRILTGLAEQAEVKPQAEIFPNPFSGETTLKLAAAAAGNTTVVMLNMLGQAVHQQQVAPGAIETTLTLSDLPDGLYTAKITTGEKSSFIKLIKNR